MKKKNKKIENLGIEKEKEYLKKAKIALELIKKKEKPPIDQLKAIQILINRNQNLVKYLARGYSLFSGVDYEDLVSTGIESLPKAIEKFDLNIKGRFATYAGHWIRQYFQSLINKSQFINQNSKKNEIKNKITFYDINHQSGDDDGKSYSLVDTLDEKYDEKTNYQEIKNRDILIKLNDIINKLENRESIVLLRINYKIKPSNFFDIYKMSDDEEKEKIEKWAKIKDKNKLFNFLKNFSLSRKKNILKDILEKYLFFFNNDYKFSLVAKIIKKSENLARKIKKESLIELRKIAVKENLIFFLEE